MAFFEQMSQKLSQTGRDAVRKTKDMTELMKLNNAIPEEQRKIEANYREIGKIYYENFADNPDLVFQNYIEKIRQSEAAILEMKSVIQQLKGTVSCPACGSEQPSGSAFCNNCGAKMPKPEIQMEHSLTEDGIACKACGAVMREGMAFCTNCGAKLEAECDT